MFGATVNGTGRDAEHPVSSSIVQARCSVNRRCIDLFLKLPIAGFEISGACRVIALD
jgi:hypothetical protein